MAQAGKAKAVKTPMIDPEKTEKQKARRAQLLLYALVLLLIAIPAVLYVVFERGR